jgi:predicted small secreted protein
MHCERSTRRSTARFSIAQVSVVFVLAALLLSGCAGTARGTGSSVFAGAAAVDATDYSLSRADALVVIRYPAIIHADAELSYFHAFSINAIGGEVPPANRTKKVTTRIAQSVLAKSNYYVMSLYRELQRALPEHTVLLSPHIVMWDAERGVYSRPILATEQIPSVLTIDFNVYSYPDPTELMESPPVTFGDLVTPLVTVHGNHWMQPTTHGLVLSSEPLLPTAWSLSREQARRGLDTRLAYTPQPWQRPLDFIAYLNRRTVAERLPVKGVGDARLELMAVEQYPVEKIRMDGALLANLADEFTRDPFAESLVRGAAANVLEMLNAIDHDRATFFARHAALARFDPELATAFLARAGGESVRARLQLAEALIEAERRFISAQSAGLYEGAYLGDFGSQMREMIEGEYRLLEDRRDFARKQNVTTAFAALALAGSLYAASASGAVSGVAMQGFAGVSMLGSLWAMSKTLETRAESAQMSENFLALIAPALERQISVQMEWLDSQERISALGFAEFRNKTLTLYQARIRSLQGQFEDNCRFAHPGVGTDGRWYGGCRDGLAQGRGYGVVRDAAGDTVEYLGEAAGGPAASAV